jgi:hypothetical protein
MAQKSLERSKLGRRLAEYIKAHHVGPAELRKFDTVDLIRLLEMIVNMLAELPATFAAETEVAAANVLRLAKDGDRRALGEYLKNQRNPITPDIRAHLIENSEGRWGALAVHDQRSLRGKSL